MRALVICPADRSALAFLGRDRPLALVPILGNSLLDVWLTELASRGARDVRILATDRPEQIRAEVGRGERWGLRVEVVPEPAELTPEDALRKHRPLGDTHWLPAPFDAIPLDHLPGSSPGWDGPKAWYGALRDLLAQGGIQRLGAREWSPGIWVHVRARIAPTARLEAPCWIGAHAWIGARCLVGPGTVIEEGAYLDEGVEVADSFIGPGTYLGAMTEVRQSLAWGRGLCKWTTGSCTEVTDDFLMGSVGDRASHGRRASWTGRALALAALALTAPWLAWAWWRRPRGQPFLTRLQAVRAPSHHPDLMETLEYRELNGIQGLARRWPQLWNIVRGDFAWVGNRPLTRDQARTLHDDFERLWLAVRPGLISLADAEGCPDPFGDEARAHASFYSVQHSFRTDLQILLRTLGCTPRQPSDTLPVTSAPNS
ncbi:MAG: sugar transferase [Verrucomicrobiae bacterium]|nr:sugar transferase [Verrucomicrobiae bacterium]